MVQGVDAESTSPERAEHLNVLQGIAGQIGGQTAPHQIDNGVGDFVGFAADEKIVAVFSGAHGYFAPPDAVRVGDDGARRGLAEHLRQSGDRYASRCEHVLQHRTRADGRQLIFVADQHQTGSGANGLEQMVEQRQIDHRCLVDDDGIGGERTFTMEAKLNARTGLRMLDFEQAVQRTRRPPRRFVETLGRPAGWSCQLHFEPAAHQLVAKGLQHRRFARARPARDDAHTGTDGKLNRPALLFGQRDAVRFTAER